MKRNRRSIAGLLLLLCSCSLLAVACGGQPQSSTHKSSSRLNWHESAASTQTPGASSNVTGEFVGTLSNTTAPAWIVLSTSGSRLVALTSDGTSDHKPTFAQWFQGSVQNNKVTATPVDVPSSSGTSGTATPGTSATPGMTSTPESTPGTGSGPMPGVRWNATPSATGAATGTPGTSKAGKLTATLSANSVNGTVVLSDGQSYPFTAQKSNVSSQNAVLYRGEQTVNGTTYVGGWIVTTTPSAGPSSTATPGATATSGATETPGATATSGSATPGATGTATSGVPENTGVIINEKTGEVTQAPPLTSQDVASKQVDVPDLGTFKLQACQQGQC